MSYYYIPPTTRSTNPKTLYIPSTHRRPSNYDTSRQDSRSTGTPHNSSHHQDALPYTPPRRSYTTNTTDPYHHRDVSPPRSSAEAPRTGLTSPQYADHRSVSPLGTSRFEEASPYRRQPTRSQTLGEVPHMGYDGYFSASDATQGYTGAGLSRSNAVRGRANERGFGCTVYAGGARDERRRGRYGDGFGSSRWERY
jgi:hypothetical protein